MKSYMVLCMNCNGTGFIQTYNSAVTVISTEVCPVCKGTKVQMIHETDGSIIPNISCDNLTNKK